MDFNPQDLVLYLDDHLLAIDKPPGLPVLPDGYHPEAPYVRSVLEPLYGRLWTVHRLDRGTSGLLVLARSTAAHRALNTQFEQRQTVKRYHALVRGSPPWDEHTADMPLLADGDRHHRTRVDARLGKPAVTGLRVLERLGAFTLIEASPQTGRTHQIRAHLAALELPIAGDTLYGGGGGIAFPPAGAPRLERMALHAWSLEIVHPATGERLRLQAPYPADLEAVLEYLRAANSDR
jgi:tRNA pseudouridine32 synthase/23S rRNA pseudouridine746 synthase